MKRIDDLQYKNLKIIQDTDGFCFGIDSVILTEFAKKDMKKNKKIVDLGAGTGILGILLAKKVEAFEIIGVEVQKDVAEMAQKSVELNNLQNIIKIINEDIHSLTLEKNTFDYVIQILRIKEKEQVLLITQIKKLYLGMKQL